MILSALALVSIVLFMTLNLRGRWDFVLALRATKVAGMVAVACAIALSTVLFQTITNNRILTPALMGFDSLYLLLQTSLVFFAGTQAVSGIPPEMKFAVLSGAMILLSMLLYRWLFARGQRSLYLLVLAGIIFGILFRSLATFMQRLLDPNSFVVLHNAMFASFNTLDRSLLATAALVITTASIMAWRLAPVCDVLALGRETAISLGVEHRRSVMVLLVLTAVLVSVSTALAGPVTFFGLLVANLTYILIGTHRHRVILPAAMLIAVISLIGGQLILERLFAFNSELSIIIEFIGGLVFILLLMRGTVR